MNRLLKIGFNLAIFSFVPILSWFVLGFVVDKNLINVFTLTYPIQFIWLAMKSIFAVSPNICKEKENNQDIVMTGIVLGIIFGLIVFGVLAFYIDYYISFMNMDVSTYHAFGLYSVLSLGIQLIFSLLIEKLYYEDKNTKANIHMVTFNLLNFITLVISAFLFKSQMQMIVLPLISIFIYVVILFFMEGKKFKFDINYFRCMKYDTVDLVDNLLFFIIFIFGISNASSYGIEYVTALNFVAMVTDTQWDAFESIATVAKIDISRNQFSYIEHVRNAYRLLGILFLTTIILSVIMFPFYELNLSLVVIYFLFEFINFIIYPIYRLKTCFLQLEYSPIKITTNKLIASVGRTLLTFLKTPFCTGIGQVSSSIYQFISLNIIFKRNYVIKKDGRIERKDHLWKEKA